MEEKIYMIVTNERSNLSKVVNVTDYTCEEFFKSCNVYAKNFDVKIKRITV